MLHPDKAEREGQTLRLSSQIVHMVAPDQLKDELLPTPAAYDGMKGGSQHPAKRRAGGHQPSVADVVEHLLPTPCASPSGNAPEEHLRKKPGRERVTDLSILVENDLLVTGGKLLPTPRASDGEKGGPNQRGSKGDLTMASAVHQQFGPYADAIARWEAAMGRKAPAPTELTPKGKHRLSARFVEWMMGQSDGWVTDEELGLSRVQQLRALGNGVVTQQAVFAIAWLLTRVSRDQHKEVDQY